MTPKPPPSFLDRLRAFDPAVLPIVVAAIVLIGAVVWLLGRPLPPPQAADTRLQDQLAAMRGELSRLEGLAQRVSALETRTGPDLAPLREQIASASGRAEAFDRRIAALEGHDSPDLAPLRQEMAAAATRLGAVEERLTAAQREVAGRAEATLREAQAAAAQAQQRLAAADQTLGGLAARLAAAESGIAARGQANEAQAARIGAVEQQAAARIAALEQQSATRLGALEQSLGQRLAALVARLGQVAGGQEQQQGRIATLEGAGQRLSALEGRAARLAALDAARAALEAGRPLGASLAALPSPPAALTRFASAAPPTEAALRLSFADAARAARAASEPSSNGTVLDSAAARIQNLVTIRRGEQVLWGDAAAAEIERARRAMEAGDLEGALRILQRLPPGAREAMGDWLAQAESLVAARASLRQMAAG